MYSWPLDQHKILVYRIQVNFVWLPCRSLFWNNVWATEELDNASRNGTVGYQYDAILSVPFIIDFDN